MNSMSGEANSITPKAFSTALPTCGHSATAVSELPRTPAEMIRSDTCLNRTPVFSRTVFRFKEETQTWDHKCTAKETCTRAHRGESTLNPGKPPTKVYFLPPFDFHQRKETNTIPETNSKQMQKLKKNNKVRYIFLTVTEKFTSGSKHLFCIIPTNAIQWKISNEFSMLLLTLT